MQNENKICLHARPSLRSSLTGYPSQVPCSLLIRFALLSLLFQNHIYISTNVTCSTVPLAANSSCYFFHHISHDSSRLELFLFLPTLSIHTISFLFRMFCTYLLVSTSRLELGPSHLGNWDQVPCERTKKEIQ